MLPTQPDQQDPGVPAAGSGPTYTLVADPVTNVVTTCRDGGGAETDLAACLAAAAYSLYNKFTTERVVAVDDRILDDSFESGNMSAWTHSSPSADLCVDPTAGMAATRLGLLGEVNDVESLFVEDDTPDQENRYRARFYVDVNGFDPGEAAGHRRTRLFIAFGEGPRRLSAIVLRRVDGAYTLQGRARQDDGSQADTDWVPLTRGPHRIEVDWLRSSGPDANDGRFRFWLDGMLVGDLTGLDNSRQPIEFVRLGALSVKGAAAGPLRFDHFQANRMSAPPPQ
jgi:hypothetical protein